MKVEEINKKLFTTKFINQRQFWLQKYENLTIPYFIFFDPSQAEKEGTKISKIKIDITDEISEKILKISNNKDLSVFIVLYSVLSVMLEKQARKDFSNVITPIFQDIKTEETINKYIYLVLKNQSEKIFKERLIQAGKTVIESYNNQDYPQEIIEDFIVKQFDLTSFPTTNVGIAYKPIHENWDILSEDQKCIFSFEKENERIIAEIQYDERLYPGSYIDFLAKRYVSMLNQCMENVEIKLEDLVLIPEEEKDFLIHGLNQTEVEYDTSKTFLDIFKEQVILNGDKVAVKCGENEWTYSELNKKADQIAYYLSDRGIGKENKVVLLMERSEWMMASILAVWKVGAAYIPVDINYPEARLTEIITDSGAELLLCLNNNDLQNITSLVNESNRILIIEKLDLAAAFGSFMNEPSPDDLSYIIYTSGSTGKPKGVQIEHKGMLNHLYLKVNSLEMNEQSLLVQNSPHTFDISVWQFFAAVMVGGTTIVFPNELVLNPEGVIKNLIENNITIFETVPSYLSVLLETLENENIPLQDLKYLLVTGEAVKPSLINRWFNVYEDIKVVNAYGPTEASDDITQYEMTSFVKGTIVPIGKTVQNMAIYLVDDDMNLVPFGEKGEITVAGIGVGRGYLNNEEKTKESFLANPFNSKHPKLYKTSDIGQYNNEGTLLYYGRKDSQVKIRGHRIELGEIEHKLTTINGIKDAVLTTFENHETNQLVAFVILDSEFVFNDDSVKLGLGELLPEYMIPSFIIPLEKLPLSANGKVDKSKLPLENILRKHAAKVKPENSVEVTLVEIFEEVLKIGEVGIEDNFFSLGGHSVAAIQVVSRIKKYLQVDIPLALVFEHPTIKDLSSIVHNALQKGEDIGYLINIPKHEKHTHYPVAPVQYPEWYMQKLNPRSTFYNFGFLVDLKGNLQIDHFITALNTILQRHDSFNISFKEENGKPILIHNAVYRLTKENFLVDLSSVEDSQKEVKEFIRTNYDQVLNLEKSPVNTIKLIQSAKEEFIFMFETHHIIWDQTSSFIFARELQHVYNSLIHDEPVQLEDLPVNYVDYASWMNSLLVDGKLEKERKYWLNKFKTCPDFLELPLDRPRPLIQSFDGAYVYKNASHEFKQKLDNFCKQNDTTLQIFLLSVFNLLLFRLTGQNDFVIGTPILNRDHEDLENVIGLFASALPIRVDNININESFQVLHDKTMKSSLEAYENRMYPFNRIIEELDIPMDFARSKIISVFFGVQNDESEFNAFQLEGMTVNDYILDETLKTASTSVFDLTMQVDQAKDYLLFSIRYNSDLFDTTTMDQFMSRYIHLVDQCIDSVNLPLHEYSIIEEEEQKVIDQCINVPVVPSQNSHILEQFEKQISLNPQAIAIDDGDFRYSYHQLNEQAEKIAKYLILNNVEEQQNIGVLIPRSFNQIAAVLGIMKANCVFVPLSLEYPAERIMAINSSAELKFIISHDSICENYEVVSGANWLDIDTISNNDTCEIVNNRKPQPEDLAYILYTSGSTGKPKGIAISHNNFINTQEATQSLFTMQDEKRALYATSFVFDASLLEYLWPLAYGASVVIYEEKNDKNIADLVRYAIEKQIHFIQFVPLLLEEFLGEIKRNDLSDQLSLELVFVGGAILPKRIVSLFSALLNCKLYNCYGPTEITVDAARFDCTEEFKGEIVPIGKPIQNTQLFVFDSAQKLCPVGVKGELYIASAGVSKGYLNAPEKNNEHFIQPEYSLTFGNRLYKTGDIAYYDKNGNVVVQGRNDLQVKINGNRVELEEVEHQLIGHPSISKAVFTVANAFQNSNVLLGYAELEKSINSFKIGDEVYKLLTLDQQPTLKKEFDYLHSLTWPEYFEGSAVIRDQWNEIYEKFPHLQYALCNSKNEVILLGNGVPIAWDNTVEGLPQGWDGTIRSALESTEKPNTLSILAGIIHPDYQSKGLSKHIVDCFHQLKKEFKFEHLIAPIRPIGKVYFQDMSLDTYVQRRGKDSLSEDLWLRTHERAGGKILKTEPNSQKVVGTVSQWEKWTNQSFESTGEYLVKDALMEMEMDLEKGIGVYYDPCVWLDHSSFQSENTWKHIVAENLKSYLEESLPPYMIPNSITIIPELPVLESGKVDRSALLESLNMFSDQPYALPENLLQDQLLKAFMKITGNEYLGIYDDFFAFGIHSINILRLIAEIKQTLQVEVKIVDIFQNRTVKKLAYHIQVSNLAAAGGSSYFHALSSGKDKNLICIPSISTSPFEFHALAEKVKDYNVLVLDLSILNNYSNVKVSANNITSYCVQQILNLGTKLPMSILGYSAGGVFGYEIIQELEKQNVFVSNFLIVDTLPKQTSKNIDIVETEKWIENIRTIASKQLPSEVKQQSDYLPMDTIKRYLELNSVIINKGKIKTPVTILYNENVKEEDYSEWHSLTEGKLNFYRLFGDHFSVLNKENIGKNSKEWENLLAN